MMAEEVQKQATGFIKKSSYANFMPAIDKINRMAESYQVLLLDAVYTDADDRTEIVRYANLLRGEFIDGFLDDAEKTNISNKYKTLEQINNTIARYESYKSDAIKPAIMDAIKVFESQANEYAKYYNRLLLDHNMSAIPMKQKQEIERLFSVMNSSMRFLNRDRIPISPQMELFCRALYNRVFDKWYNIGIVEGEPGSGKTNFVWAASSTLASMFGMKWNPATNIILNEQRTYVEHFIKKMPPYDILDLDEAGNQANAKTSYVEEQLSLLNRLNLDRFMGYTFWLTWPYAKGLDSTVRNKQSQFIVSIQERGTAIVRTLNKNPYVKDALSNPRRFRETQVDTHEEAGDMLEGDLQTVLTIPFYEIPAKLWKAYEEKKLVARQVGNELTTRSDAARFYLEYLLQVDPNMPAINNADLDRFSIKVNYKLYLSSLLKKICKATGQKASDIYHSDSPSDPSNIGNITVNKWVKSYIENLQAERKGAEQLSEENKDENK